MYLVMSVELINSANGEHNNAHLQSSCGQDPVKFFKCHHYCMTDMIQLR